MTRTATNLAPETNCGLTVDPIDVDAALRRAYRADCGAVASFLGVARRTSSSHPGRSVTRLEYEAYAPMAVRELETIAQEAIARYGAAHVAAVHRIGVLELGEAAVVVVVATPHRAEAFDACRYVIEQLKLRVPIWKKEVFDDGSEWVDPRP